VGSRFFGSITELADIVRLTTVLDDLICRPDCFGKPTKENFTFVFHLGVSDTLPVLVGEGPYELSDVSRFH
jgi:hypothetical protein